MKLPLILMMNLSLILPWMIKVSLILSRVRLPTVYKAFVRPHLDYGDIIYDKPDNESFKKLGRESLT